MIVNVVRMASKQVAEDYHMYVIRCVYISRMQANYICVMRNIFLNISPETSEGRLYKQLDIISEK